MSNSEDLKEKLIDHLSETEGHSDPDSAVAQEWIQASEENQKTYQDSKKIWQSARLLKYFSHFNPSKGWQVVDRRIRQRQRKIRYLTHATYLVTGMAASLLLIFLLNILSPDHEQSLTVSTGWGDRSDVVLPDGSFVKLNSGSTLSYHYDPDSKTRFVEFAGEAFFHVSKGKGPFTIKIPEELELAVLGTKFNLQAYPEDKFYKTTLTEGKVKLTTTAKQVLFLSPGEVAAFNKEDGRLTRDPGEPTHQLSWMVNKLYMDNMSLEEVCVRMERWYNVHITINDPDIASSIHYTGVLSEETITDVLDALSRLSAIQYRIKGKNIVITKR